jgi:prolipoprotein diacylglyceryltransferase
MLLFIFFILIGIQRFTIEQWRDISGRDLYPFLGMLLKQSELISIILGIVGFAGVIALSMYYKKNPYTIPNAA